MPSRRTSLSLPHGYRTELPGLLIPHAPLALAKLHFADEMENQFFTCRLAHERMVELASYGQPGPETTNGVLMARTLVAESVIGTVEKAVELVGGRSFYRNLGLERLNRHVQAARFHPMPAKPQQLCAGRHAFGLDLDGI